MVEGLQASHLAFFPDVSSFGQFSRSVIRVPVVVTPFIHKLAEANNGEEGATTTLEHNLTLAVRGRGLQKNRHRGNQTQSTANRD
jgi:hypothetical protein